MLAKNVFSRESQSSGKQSTKEELELNLADISPGEEMLISENKNKSFKSVLLKNVVPSKKYSVRHEIERRMLEPLNINTIKSSFQGISYSLDTETSDKIRDAFPETKNSKINSYLIIQRSISKNYSDITTSILDSVANTADSILFEFFNDGSLSEKNVNEKKEKKKIKIEKEINDFKENEISSLTSKINNFLEKNGVYNKIDSLSNDTIFKDKIDNFLKAQKNEAVNRINEEVTSIIKKAKDQLDSSLYRKISLKINVKTGETVKVFVSSGDSTWTFILKGKQPGKWVTTYGFGFTLQRLESRTYVTKQLPNGSAFEIVKARKPNIFDVNYVPAVFFSYFPSNKFNSRLNPSATAGLGFDLSAPVVFLCFNLMYFNNIGCSIGLAFQEQDRLKDKYAEDDIISDELDTDQLHDKVYRPNVFFSINFRFGESPFESKKDDE